MWKSRDIALPISGLRWVQSGVFALLLLGAVAGAGVVPPRYVLTDLGTVPGDTGSAATALNDRGQVVGDSWLMPSAGTRAFLYSGGNMIDLGLPYDPGAPEGSGGTGVNNSGQVVGDVSGLGSSTAFLYSGGILHYLSTPAVRTDASGINASGQIAGSSDFGAPGGDFHATLYSGGTTRDLGTLGGAGSGAFAVNAAGQVVGHSLIRSDANAVHPFLYSNGSMHDLGTLGGGTATAYAINDSGQVVGDSFTNPQDNTIDHAFLYSGGSMHDLGTLGGKESTARGINDSGLIVGDSYTDATLTRDRAFLYANGTMYNLNSLIVNGSGYVVQSANAINASGQIAGTAITPGGDTHAVLLTPTSVPLPLAVWAILPVLPLLVSTMRMKVRQQR